MGNPMGCSCEVLPILSSYSYAPHKDRFLCPCNLGNNTRLKALPDRLYPIEFSLQAGRGVIQLRAEPNTVFR